MAFGHSGNLFLGLFKTAFTSMLRGIKSSSRILDSRLNIPAGITMVGRCNFEVRARYTNDTVVVRIPETRVAQTIEWMVSSDLVIEVHGQCLAIYTRDLKKIGEAFVEAPVPVVLNEIQDSRLSSGSTERCGVRISTTAPHSGMEIRIRHKNFQIENRGIASPTGPWRHWHQADRSLTYLLEPPRSVAGRARLVVVFSAISKPYDFTYNYRAAISELDSYRLFILDDFGRRGSYYFSDHKDRSIYDSVQAFLRHILHDLGIKSADTAFVGSSKGGTAALIHGLPMAVGNIIVGAPQSLPGAYLISSDPAILGFIAGDSGPAGRDWLDNSIGELLSEISPGTQIRLLVGNADHHLSAHVRPLEAKLGVRGAHVSTLVVQGVDHQDIGRPFGAYLRQLLDERKGQPADAVVPYELAWQSREENCALLRVWIPQGEVIAIRAYAGTLLLANHDYSGQESYLFSVPKGESVRVRIYRKCVGSRRRRGAFTTRWLRPAALY
jgi:hypothetical protein